VSGLPRACIVSPQERRGPLRTLRQVRQRDRYLEVIVAERLHKLTLSVFRRNEAAIALYRKFGFVEEGRRIRHIRRTNGELWDLIEMGPLL
jgi:RimJ/RimL family protein N-acetyltransferase